MRRAAIEIDGRILRATRLPAAIATTIGLGVSPIDSTLLGTVNALDCAAKDRLLSLCILEQHVRVDCPDPAVHALLVRNFQAMSVHGIVEDFDLRYRVASSESSAGFELIRDGQPALDCEDLGDVLHSLERDLVVELQRRRADLFFLHAACLEWRGRACLLAAESGSGKSTTAWGLLHHRFRYLSDELGPVDLSSLRVWAYPHALKLRNPPVQSYPLPREALRLDRTTHIPTRSLPAETLTGSLPLGAVLLLSHRPELDAPELHSLSPAEAAARLYANALNALAHPAHGLDAVVRIAESVPCFSIASAELVRTCEVISRMLAKVL